MAQRCLREDNNAMIMLMQPRTASTAPATRPSMQQAVASRDGAHNEDSSQDHHILVRRCTCRGDGKEDEKSMGGRISPLDRPELIGNWRRKRARLLQD